MDEKSTAELLKWGAIAVGGYLLYQAITSASSIASNAGAALTNTGTDLGGWLYNLFNPGAAGESEFYTATLPDGSMASVPASTVNSDGTVTYNGVNYQLMVNNSITSGVNKTLVPTN